MLLLSEKCKIWRLEWSRLVVWLQTAFGDNPSEICARKTRGISVSHICAKIQPLLSSAWEECNQWTFFIPTNGLMMQRNLFLSYFSRFDFLPIRIFMEYIRKWYLESENSWVLQCAIALTSSQSRIDSCHGIWQNWTRRQISNSPSTFFCLWDIIRSVKKICILKHIWICSPLKWFTMIFNASKMA